MIAWIFVAITLSAALLATFVTNTRQAILSLWVAGLGIGALYLTIGAEFLAIIQWIVSTLVTISFVFFAVMFGEYHSAPSQEKPKGHFLLSLLSIFLGAGFSAVIWVGARFLPGAELLPAEKGIDLGTFGKGLTQGHLLSLEVLALTLFLVLVGGGVVARSEDHDS